MTPERALKLIETAMEFYVRANYEVAANCYELGYDREGYCRGAFEKRSEMREALALVKSQLGHGLTPTTGLNG